MGFDEKKPFAFGEAGSIALLHGKPDTSNVHFQIDEKTRINQKQPTVEPVVGRPAGAGWCRRAPLTSPPACARG